MKPRLKSSTQFLVLALVAMFACILCAPPGAQAQSYRLDPTVTTGCAATTTNAVTSTTVDLGKYDEFALQIKGALTGSGTSAVTYTIAASIDGTNWVDRFSLPITAAGTTTATAGTNVTAGGWPFWKVSTIGNANANAWTNALVMIATKRAVLRYSPY